jgi:hypothetical protein
MRVCMAGEGSGSDLGELVGLAMGQVAVKWNTTDERRVLVLERVREWRATRGAAGR